MLFFDRFLISWNCSYQISRRVKSAKYFLLDMTEIWESAIDEKASFATFRAYLLMAFG